MATVLRKQIAQFRKQSPHVVKPNVWRHCKCKTCATCHTFPLCVSRGTTASVEAFRACDPIFRVNRSCSFRSCRGVTILIPPVAQREIFVQRKARKSKPFHLGFATARRCRSLHQVRLCCSEDSRSEHGCGVMNACHPFRGLAEVRMWTRHDRR